MGMLDDSNLFMSFRYEGTTAPVSFGYVLDAKGFFTIVVQGAGGREAFKEESVVFPNYLMHGSTRDALVQYLDGRKFACYVPVFPTEAEVKKYMEAFREG